MYMTEDGSAIQCDCGSEDDPIGHLWESFSKVQYALKFILQQILTSHNLCHLSRLVEELEYGWSDEMIFAENLDGELYMSLGFSISG